MSQKTKPEKPELKYIHMRSEQHKGSVTIGYKVDHDKKVVYYSKARCAPFDNFCRKIGRDICAGRFAVHGPEGEFKFDKYEDIKAYFLQEHHPDRFDVVIEGDGKKVTQVYENFGYAG